MKGLIAGLAALLVLGVGFFLYSSPTAPSAEMTEAEIAQIEAEVVQFADAYTDVWRGNDCEGSRDLLHPTRWVRIYDGKPNRDIDEWMRRCEITLANRASFSSEGWIDTEVRVLSPDAAVFIGTNSYTMTYRDDTPARHYPSNTTIMNLERTPDGWRLTSYQNATSGYEVVEEG